MTNDNCSTSTKPRCFENACAKCNEDVCTGTKPKCKTAGDCAACDMNTCYTSEAPFCKADGSCGKCAADTDCTGNTEYNGEGLVKCDTATGICVECLDTAADCTATE